MWLGIVASLGVSRRVVKKYLESFIMRAKIEKCGNHGNPPCRSPCHREGIRSGARPPLRAGPVAIPRRRRRRAEISRGARVPDGLVLPQTDLARMNVVLGGSAGTSC